MKLLNDSRIEDGLRALESATRRVGAVCDSVTARRAASAPAPREQPARVGRTTQPTPIRPRTPTPIGLALIVVGAAVTVACPRLPPVSGCTVGTMICEGDRPRVCSASQRWEPAGDVTCHAVGGACALNDAGVAHCAPVVSDGGVE